MITERLAEFVLETDGRSIPDGVMDTAQWALIDTLGVGLAGRSEPAGQLAIAWVREVGGRPQATVWGEQLSGSPADVAFANGITSHALDFDDSLPSLRGHPSTTMIPTALAVGEAVGASGAEALAAFAIGVEVAGTLGKAVGHEHYFRGWHTTATIGTLGATAVAGRLWGLDKTALQHAFGLAASQMAGLTRNFGTMTKPFHAGHAARCGVTAAWMAAKGFTADTSIFDGENSLLATYGGKDGQPLEGLLETLASPWEMQEPGIYVKMWPCCYANHRAVGGLFALLEEERIQAEEIQAIRVGFLPGSDNALIHRNPQTGLEGKFSVEYVAAATIIDRNLRLETFTDHMVQRPALRAMMAKVERFRIPDDRYYSGVVGFTDVVITTGRGEFTRRVDKTPGSPAWPLSAEARLEKFRDCAAGVLGEKGTEEVLSLALQARTLADVRPLLASVRIQTL